MKQSMLRASRCVLLAAAFLAFPLTSARAQDDGFNFHVLSNVGNVTYFGIGAGSGSTPGTDVTGYWVGGEDLQGSTLTSLTVGGVPQFGYKQAGMRLSACVFNLGANSRLDFPAIFTVEYDDTSTTDGFNFHNPYNFLRPGCGAGTAGAVPAITTNIFGAPTGTPPGASVQWIVFGLPTFGVPPSVVLVSPNHALVPSTLDGTVAIVSFATFTAAITATGCFDVDLDWSAVTTASAVPALDNVAGWWTQLTASRDNNQYWLLSNDQLQVVKSNTAFSSGGASSIFTPLASVDLELHYFSIDPVTHAALAPTSFTADNSFYETGAPGPTGNQGFDLGTDGALSFSALQGAHTLFGGDGSTLPPPGINPQDVANAALNIGPTPTGGAVTNSLGFVTWNNNSYAALGSGARVTWLQLDLDLLAAGALDPSAMTTVRVFFGQVRVPVRIPDLAGSWPSALTIQFLPLFTHVTADETGNPAWPDPSGNPAGSLGVAPVVGQSVHVPVFGASGACAFNGLPIGLAYGSSGLTGPGTGPLVWDSTANRVSVGRSILLYD